MFSNEVLISKNDKKELINLIEKAKEILDKYPYEKYDGSHTVTTMSRAKSLVKESFTWCSLLHEGCD